MADNNMQFVNTTNFSDLEGDMPADKSSNTKTSGPVGGGGGSGGADSGKSDGSTTLNMGSSTSVLPASTLDEPVSTTILRDLRAVALKLGHVFYPTKSNILLKDWDLWAPLSLCVLLSVSLQSSDTQAGGPEFATIFSLITLGAIVVTINIKLLSGKISFFQSICVLGYCLLPLVLVAILNQSLLYLLEQRGAKSITLFVVHLTLVVCACAWSIYASTAFLGADSLNLSDRKALAVFPILLFYFVIGWLIVLDRT